MLLIVSSSSVNSCNLARRLRCRLERRFSTWARFTSWAGLVCLDRQNVLADFQFTVQLLLQRRASADLAVGDVLLNFQQLERCLQF